jgi:hypothetical protein
MKRIMDSPYTYYCVFLGEKVSFADQVLVQKDFVALSLSSTESSISYGNKLSFFCGWMISLLPSSISLMLVDLVLENFKPPFLLSNNIVVIVDE